MCTDAGAPGTVMCLVLIGYCCPAGWEVRPGALGTILYREQTRYMRRLDHTPITGARLSMCTCCSGGITATGSYDQSPARAIGRGASAKQSVGIQSMCSPPCICAHDDPKARTG